MIDSDVQLIDLNDPVSDVEAAIVAERRRISRELHDHLQQLLVVANMRLSCLGPQAEDDAEHVEQASRAIREAMDYVRSLTVQMCPRMLDEQGLAPAAKLLIADMSKRFNVKMSFESNKDDLDLDIAKRHFFYGCMRELAFNAIRHGGAGQVWITINKHADGYCMTARDNGVGFTKSAGDLDSKGYGLSNIIHQVNCFGGTVDIKNTGSGCLVSVSLPDKQPSP